MSELWLVATPDGKHPRVLRAATEMGAILARVKDDEDVPRGGVWAVWRLGAFPEQFDLDGDGLPRGIGRPSLIEGRGR